MVETQQRYACPKERDSLIGKYLKQTHLILITKDFASSQWTIRIWKNGWDLTLVQIKRDWNSLDSLCKNVHRINQWPKSMQKKRVRHFMVLGKPHIFVCSCVVENPTYHRSFMFSSNCSTTPLVHFCSLHLLKTQLFMGSLCFCLLALENPSPPMGDVDYCSW